MHIWRFYLKPNEKNVYAYKDTDKYSLYACTNNKEYAKTFKAERNMNLFKVVKSEADMDEWQEYSKENGDCVLKIKTITTRKEHSKDREYALEDIPVLCTEYEYQTVDSDFAESMIEQMQPEYWDDAIHPAAFGKKCKRALEVLQYDSLYELLNYRAAEEYNKSDVLDIPNPNVNIDELGLFVNIFGFLF